MRRRTQYTLAAVLLVLCAMAAVLYLRQKAPPEVARLLPESDAIVYVNLKPLRAATHFDRSPVTRSPSFQQFMDATGIVIERDLDAVAFALHRMPNANGPNGLVAFTEVFEGRFDSDRLRRYLASLCTSQESYAGHTIYSIPSDGRTLRVTQLGYDTIAASNAPTPEQIHSVLERSRAAASPFSGSALLEARYAQVPAFSSAWAIGRLGLPFTQSGRISVAGLELPLSPDTDFIASLRYSGALHLRVDEIARSEAEAAESTQSLTTLLNLFRSLQTAQQPTPRTPSDVAMRQFTESILIEQHKDRTTLTATIPTETLRKLSDAKP